MEVYTVFRRHPDGYVNAVAGENQQRNLKSDNHGTMRGKPTTFEIIMITNHWWCARARIEIERSNPAHPTF